MLEFRFKDQHHKPTRILLGACIKDCYALLRQFKENIFTCLSQTMFFLLLKSTKIYCVNKKKIVLKFNNL